MKTMYKLKKTVIILFAGFIIACGVETVAAIIFLPAFATTWPVENNEDYSVDSQPDEANKNVHSGIFEGEELHQTNPDLNGNFLSGSFIGLDIEFTIERNNVPDVQYIGKMVPISDTDHTIVRIVLNSSEGSLVLAP